MLRVLSVCAVSLVVLAARAASGERWEVRTRGGVVRGARVAGRGYYAFQGIPYAAPPTGDNRFRAPRPAAPWAGVLEAHAPRLCVQPRYGGGREDCLALDVFAPRAPAAEPRAVLVYVHGGGFLFNDLYLQHRDVKEAVGPLLQLGIIVVTINYRMGALGFLSLGTEEVPGNAGLRDQIMALEWVQDNIGAFGGDAARVTLAGTSAGAASVHYLALAPAADRLFHRAICLDGTALAGKFIVTYPLTNARRFARLLGFESDDVVELTKFYKEVPVEKIVNQSMNFNNFDNGELGFAPSVERSFPGVRAVVARAPAAALALNARPTLLTYCDDEGSLRASDLRDNMYKYNADFSAFMPLNLDFPSLDVKYEEANKTRTLYFGNRTISPDVAEEFSNFWGDKDFFYPAVFTAWKHAERGFPAHVLEFTHEGGLSFAKEAPAAAGASHGDIFNYLMPPRAAPRPEDRRVVQQITTIIANFVKTGSIPARLRVGPAAARAPPAPAALALWDRLYGLYRRTDYAALTQPPQRLAYYHRRRHSRMLNMSSVDKE